MLPSFFRLACFFLAISWPYANLRLRNQKLTCSLLFWYSYGRSRPLRRQLLLHCQEGLWHRLKTFVIDEWFISRTFLVYTWLGISVWRTTGWVGKECVGLSCWVTVGLDWFGRARIDLNNQLVTYAEEVTTEPAWTLSLGLRPMRLTGHGHFGR